MRQVRILFLILIAAFLMFLSGSLSLAQEETVPEEAPSVSEPETLWLWGEVVSLDSANKTLLVKYFDYETDAEKEITIAVDDKTTYENVSSIDEITAPDTVSIDYVIDANGKNIAGNINVEKPAGTQAPSAPPEEGATE